MSEEFELTIMAPETLAAGGNVTARYSGGIRTGSFSLSAVQDAVAALQHALQQEDPLALDGLLRILVMVASPTGLPPLDGEQEWANLEQATATAGVELHRIPATYSALQDALRQFQPHVFHFAGHGAFPNQTHDASPEQGSLLFCREDGGPELVGADRLVPLLASCPSLRLLFLNACQGSVTGQQSAFAGLAQRLIQQRVAAVLAMQAPVYADHALRFSQEFYQALADGDSVEQAVGQGRLRIHEVAYSWGAPTFYLQATEPFVVAPVSPALKAQRLWQKAQNAEPDRRRPLLEEALRHDPQHIGVQEALAHLEQEAEAERLYAAAQAYLQSQSWREAHRTLSQIECLIPNFRQTRSQLAEVLGQLGGQALGQPADYDAQYAQYRPILSALQEGRFVPFLGWWASQVGRPAQDGWVQGHYLPDPTEAAQELSQLLAGAGGDLFSLPQISQYTSLLDGEPALFDRLNTLYAGDYQPTLLHRLLAELPGRLREINRRSFLFCGYSLQPWYLRLLWQRMRYHGRPLHDRSSWAIVSAPSLIEGEFWRSQDVRPIDAAAEAMVAYVNQWLDQLESRS